MNIKALKSIHDQDVAMQSLSKFLNIDIKFIRPSLANSVSYVVNGEHYFRVLTDDSTIFIYKTI